MIIPGTGVFVTDAGAEISVRTAHDTAALTMTVEPLYAADVELLDGVTGELRVKAGDVLRGTLRRRGNVFALNQVDNVSPAARSRAVPGPDSPDAEQDSQIPPNVDEPPQQSAPSRADAVKAGRTVLRFLRGEPGVSLRMAQRALSVVDRFIGERERQIERDDDWS